MHNRAPPRPAPQAVFFFHLQLKMIRERSEAYPEPPFLSLDAILKGFSIISFPFNSVILPDGWGSESPHTVLTITFGVSCDSALAPTPIPTSPAMSCWPPQLLLPSEGLPTHTGAVTVTEAQMGT